MKYQLENFGGTCEFRCRLHNGWSMECHIHEYSELLYCMQGTCKVIVNNRQIFLKEQQYIFLPPNYIHQYCRTNARIICAVFSNDFIPLFFRMTSGKSIAVSALKSGDLSSVFEELPQIDKNNILLISAYLNLICAKVFEDSQFLIENQIDGVLYQKVISYISTNFTEDISLKELAKKFNYNEKYLSHSLHTLTHMHFSQLVGIYRIEYAKTLLLGTPQTPISEIALNCGFSAINTFNRVFKKSVGVTPTEYRIGNSCSQK